MWADKDLVERNALAFKKLQCMFMANIEIALWKCGCPQAILIAHHDELKAVLCEFEQSRNGIRNQAYFSDVIDLKIFRLLDKRAVAINKKDLSCHRVVLRRY